MANDTYFHNTPATPANQNTDGHDPIKTRESFQDAKKLDSITVTGEGKVDEKKNIQSSAGMDEGALPGILRSAKTPWGTSVSDQRQLTPQTTVEIPTGRGRPIRTSLATAAKLGYLQRDAQGNWIDPQADVHEKMKEEAEVERIKNTVKVDALSESERNEVMQLQARGGQEAFSGYINKAVMAMITQKPMDKFHNDYARQVKADPDSLKNFTEEIVNNALQRMIAHGEKVHGLNAEAAMEFAYNNAKPELLRSFLVGAIMGDLPRACAQFAHYVKSRNRN